MKRGETGKREDYKQKRNTIHIIQGRGSCFLVSGACSLTPLRHLPSCRSLSAQRPQPWRPACPPSPRNTGRGQLAQSCTSHSLKRKRKGDKKCIRAQDPSQYSNETKKVPVNTKDVLYDLDLSFFRPLRIAPRAMRQSFQLPGILLGYAAHSEFPLSPYRLNIRTTSQIFKNLISRLE